MLYLFDTMKRGETMSEKILVVDDEHDIADLLEVYLQNETTSYINFTLQKTLWLALSRKNLTLQFLILCFPI